MFHVKQFFTAFAFFLAGQGHSQGTVSMRDINVTYNVPPDKALQAQLKSSNDYKFLSPEEQEVAYFLNYARKNPSLFLENAINIFLLNHPEVRSSYTKSLQETFKALKPLPIILPDSILSVVARNHALDLKLHHTVSHNSSNGKTFEDRVKAYVKDCASECIGVSPRPNPLESVLSLLFDFNVPNLGHRKTMLDVRYTKAGFGMAGSVGKSSTLVMDFSCR